MISAPFFVLFTPVEQFILYLSLVIVTFRYIIFALALGTLMTACNTPTDHVSQHMILESVEADGVSGPTALGTYDAEMNNSPLSALKAYLHSNGFRIDTARFHEADDPFYQDLQKKPFTASKRGDFIYLDKSHHRMGNTRLLDHGYGYYYRLKQSPKTTLHPEFALEHWKIDTTYLCDLSTVLSDWEALYLPLCYQSVLKDDNLYILYTGDPQYGRYLLSFAKVLKSH